MPWPVDENYVVNCESAIGFLLPETYRSSMKLQNGGAVVCDGDIWKLHPIWDKSDRKRLKRTANDVVYETKAMAGWRGWPDNAVCIGADGSGDALIFLGDLSSCDPAVYRWYHETGQARKMVEDFSALQRT